MRNLILCALLTAGVAAAQDITSVDLTLGFNRHLKISEKTTFLSNGEVYEKLKRVFDRMTASDGLRVGVPVGHQLYFLDDPEVNAFATGGGRLYVTRGLMSAIEGNEGVLAFVMGHEMAHNFRQHSARKYFRAVEHDRMTYYYATRCRAGENASCWANIGYQTAYAIAEKKMERDEENEADLLGMMAAAEAGYHPDYAILAARRLRAVTGEQSKFAAFFSNHPRWTTREERAERNLDGAIAVFQKRWPTAEVSPGGVPPAMADVSELKVEKANHSQTLHAVIGMRHLRQPAAISAVLIGENDTAPVEILHKEYVIDPTGREKLDFSIADTTFKGRKGKQFVRVQVSSGPEVLCESKATRVK